MTTSLEEKIKYYDDEYREGRALITDKKFDQLERNLLRIDPKCDYFNKQNKLVLPLLPKDNLEEFLEGLLPDTRLIVEAKIDGCAIAISYKDGKLEKAISRKGIDVSEKIKTIKSIPREISIRSNFVVRGELFTKEEEPAFSQRIASGYLRSKSYEPNPKITFAAFQIINGNCNQYESLNYLRKLGFSVLESYQANRTSQVETYRQAWKSGKLFSNYPTDGIVVKINSRKLQLLREKSYGCYPFWQMAVKY